MTPYMTKDTADGPIDFSVHMTEWEPGAEVDEHLHDGAMYALIISHLLSSLQSVKHHPSPAARQAPYITRRHHFASGITISHQALPEQYRIQGSWRTDVYDHPSNPQGCGHRSHPAQSIPRWTDGFGTIRRLRSGSLMEP